MTTPFDRAWDTTRAPAPTPKPTPFDAAWDALETTENRKRGVLDTSTNAAREMDPAKLGEAQTLARRTNLPWGTVYRNLDEVRRLAGDRTFKPDEFVRENPISANWLSDEMNAGVSQGDWSRMGTMERLVGGNWRNVLIGLRSGIPVAPTNSGLAAVYSRQRAAIQRMRLMGEFGANYVNNPAIAAEVQRLRAVEESTSAPEAQNFFERMALGSAAIAPSFTEMFVASQKKGIQVGASAAMFTALAGQAGPQAALLEEAVTVPAVGAAGYAVGRTIGMFEAASQMMAGANLESLEAQERETGVTMSPLMKDMVSQTVGVVGGALDAFSAGQFLGTLTRNAGRVLGLGAERALTNPTIARAAGRAVREHLTQVGTETFTETAQQAVDLAGRQFARMATDAPSLDANVVWDELRSTAVETAIGMALLPLPGVSMDFAVDAVRIRETRATQARLSMLGEETQNSELRKRSPEKFNEWVTEVTRDGPVRNAYVPVEEFQQAVTTLFQEQGIDPARVSEEMGVTEAYQQAVVSGGDVVIPLATYIDKVAGNPELFAALQPHTRLRAGAMTLAEAEVAEKNIEKEVAKLREEMEAAKPETDAEQAIVDDVVGQLTIAAASMPAKTRYTPEQIATMAEAIAKPYVVLGRRSKQDPLQLYRSRNIRIVGPESAETLFDEGQAAALQAAQLTREEIDAYLATEAWEMKQGNPAMTARDIARELTVAPSRVEAWLAASAPALSGDALKSIGMRIAFGPMAWLRQAAFHGSPHVFDRFDLSKKGTGEGKQAFGSGIYFSTGEFAVRGYGDNVYRVDIPDSAVAKMLRWDQPLSKQPENVQDAVRSIMGSVPKETAASFEMDGDTMGSIVYGNISDLAAEISEDGVSDKQEAGSALLLQYGVPGLTYKQAGSQASREGTRNLVVFDDALVTITHRNGEPVTTQERAEFLEQRQAEQLPPTIEIDGVARPTTNSNGQPIALTEQGVRNFYQWFGASKVVDAEGRPLVVYHSTAADVTTFEMRGKSKGFFFSPSPNVDMTSRIDVRQPFERGAVVMPVYLSITNPKHIETSALVTSSVDGLRKKENAIIKEAKKQKYDGLTTDIDGDPLNFIAFEPTQIKSAIGNQGTFSPSDPSILRQGSDRPNAFLRLGVGENTIGLMKTANLSSVLHEFAHDWLNLIGDLATAEGATDDLKAEYAIVLKELGVTSKDQIGVKEQEHWARAFEKYLADGQAPSRPMARMFARFKAWMKQVYQAALDNFVPVSPELRGVFDRMLATETATDEALADTESLLDEQGPLTDAEFAAHQQAVADVKERSEAALLAKLLAESNPERREGWKERRAEIEAQVRAEVEAEPIQQAVAWMRNPNTPKEGKPSKQMLVARYGPDITKTLPRGTFTVEGGIDPDFIALSFGLESGDELITQLQAYELASAKIQRVTEERLRQEFPDLVNDSPALADEARKAVHAAVNDDVILTELKALGRSDASVPAPNIKAVKRVAQEAIDATPVRDLQPHRYLLAERKANRLAKEALRAGDIPKAAFHGRQQLLNHILYRYAQRAIEADAKLLRFAGRLSSDGMQERLGLAGPEDNRGMYRDAVNDILTRYEFTRLPNTALERRDNLRKWLTAQEEAGLPVQIPERVLNDVNQVNYRTLTVGQLREIYNTLKQIHATALLKRKMLDAKDQRDFEKLKAEAIATITQNNAMTQAFYAPDQSVMERVIEGVGYAHGLLVNPEMVARQLDGDKPNGVVQQATTEKINRANAEESTMMKDAALTYKAIRDSIPKERVKNFLDKPLRVEGVNTGPNATVGPMKGWRAFWLALNWGNQSSRDAILEAQVTRKGQPIWTQEKVEKVLATLTDAEWDAIEKIWAWINSYWPRISELQQEMVGVAPEKIEALPFTTPSGRQVTGGYYPLKYDHRFSFKAWGRQIAEATGLKEGKPITAFYSSAATKHGFTEARKGSGGSMVLLDGSVLQNHIVEVIHDLTHRKAVYDVNKFLNDPDIREAIEEAVGKGVYRMSLLPWLRRVAGERTPPTNALEQVVDHARAGTSVVAMGVKFTTALLQYSGYIPAMDVVGPKWMAVGMKEFMTNKKAATETALAMSPALRDRRESWDRDMRDAIKSGGPLTTKDVTWFYFASTADMHVAVPVWWGEYSKHIAGGATTAQAVAAADQAVRLTQGAGKTKDLATARAGGPLFRPFSMFYTYGSALYSLYWRAARNTKLGRWGKARLLGSAMATWILPAVVEALFREAIGQGPDDGADDEEKAKWWAYQIAAYPLQTLLLVRDIARAAAPDGFDYSLSPIEDAFGSLAKSIKAAGGAAIDLLDGEEEDEWTEAEVKNLVNTAGYWFHLPSKQIVITGDYIYDWMMGYDTPDTPLEAGRNLLFTRPRN